MSYYNNHSGGGDLRGWSLYDASNNGSEALFSSNPVSASTMEVVALSSSSFAIVYKDQNDSKIKSVTGTISGSTITFGTPVNVYNSTGGDNPKITALSTTKVLISWARGGAAYVRTYTISGTTMTADVSELALTGSGVLYTDVCAFSSTRAAVIYGSSSAGTKAVGITAGSGTLAKDATILTVNALNNIEVSVRALTSSTAIALYSGSSSGSALAGRIFTDSGTALSQGSENSDVTYTGRCSELRLDVVSSTKVIMSCLSGYVSLADTYTISGSTITSGGPFGVPASTNGPHCGAIVYMETDTSVDYYLCGLGNGRLATSYLATATLEVHSDGVQFMKARAVASPATYIDITHLARLSTSQAIAVYSRNNEGRATVLQRS